MPTLRLLHTNTRHEGQDRVGRRPGNWREGREINGMGSSVVGGGVFFNNLLGPIYDALGWRGDWFSLYADDGKIDDEVFCESVKRGSFRLHPTGPRRISRGCITLETQGDFNFLRTILNGTKKEAIPGSALLAYGGAVVT